MSEVNVGLLRRVQAHIREEPRRLHMDIWLNIFEDQEELDCQLANSGLPPCGTVGCIAGWAAMLGTRHGIESTATVDEIAMRAIGPGSRRLFTPSRWPIDLEDDLVEYTPGTIEYANVVCAAIDRFIDHPEEFEQ